jgi:chemotaxis protein MotB
MIPMFFRILAVTVLLSSCVSGKRYNELDARHREATRALDSLRTLSTELGAANADFTVLTSQLKTEREGLRSDTTRLGTQLRENQRRVSDLQDQHKMLEDNYRNLLSGRERETTQLMSDLREAQARLIQREDSLDILARALSEKARRLDELERILADKENEVKRIRAAVSEALRSFEGSGLTVEERNGKVYVSMSDKLMFASGSDQVDQRGQQALNELAKVLAREAGLSVTIEGHTDNVPIRPGGRLRDNLELSTMRANAIIRILLQTSGIDAGRLIAAGRGEHAPIVENDTPENRARNRRTEIIITPRLDDLFKILDSQ